MMPREPAVDIMHRTMKNLEFIRSHPGTTGPYEVTRLVNAFLRALAHPWENLKDDLKALSISDATAKGWPPIQKEQPSDREPSSLGQLIGFVRNGLAHGNIEFLPGSQGDIRAVHIWNNDHGRRTWGTIITTADMRAFLVCFVKLAEELQSPRTCSSGCEDSIHRHDDPIVQSHPGCAQDIRSSARRDAGIAI
jgi:hypothetical protein